MFKHRNREIEEQERKILENLNKFSTKMFVTI